MKSLVLAFVLFVTLPYSSFCCTSLIVSSKYTKDGRPIMMKHRDSSCKDVAVNYFNGDKYTFVAIVDAGAEPGQAWAGTNRAGFSIMNTASYNIKNDNVHSSEMDREGFVMYLALSKCASVQDFENFLDSLSRPMGVEANFGVIDAFGGAAYYEVNNYTWVKYDVNDQTVAPDGYRIVTNFSESGRKEDYKGYERYLTALDIAKSMPVCRGKYDFDHKWLFDNISRSYRHSFMGLDCSNYATKGNGIVPDQDFIPRFSTSCSMVFEGVAPGTNPLGTVMWTILGYPACSVAIPVIVGGENIVPEYLRPAKNDFHSAISDIAKQIKLSHVFRWKVSNGRDYLDIRSVVKGRDGRPALLKCASLCENEIDRLFVPLYTKWSVGLISDDEFYSEYMKQTSMFFDLYLDKFGKILKEYSLKITKLALY